MAEDFPVSDAHDVEEASHAELETLVAEASVENLVHSATANATARICSSSTERSQETATLEPTISSIPRNDEPVSSEAESEAENISLPLPPDTGEKACLSEAAKRWSKLRQNFRLAALRSIAQDKREALKKLQEVRKRADKAQEAQSDSRTCKICWDRATNTVCLDCGHQCMCLECGRVMTFCPICMQDISDLVELQ